MLTIIYILYAYQIVLKVTSSISREFHFNLNMIWPCPFHHFVKQHGIEATKEEGKSQDLNYVENLLVYPTVSPKSGEEIEPYKTIREDDLDRITCRRPGQD